MTIASSIIGRLLTLMPNLRVTDQSSVDFVINVDYMDEQDQQQRTGIYGVTLTGEKMKAFLDTVEEGYMVAIYGLPEKISYSHSVMNDVKVQVLKPTSEMEPFEVDDPLKEMVFVAEYTSPSIHVVIDEFIDELPF